MQRLVIVTFLLVLCYAPAIATAPGRGNMRGSTANTNQCTNVDGSGGTSTHLNHFTFHGADAVSFAMTSYSVTSGQPVTTNCLTTSANVLTFEAGRKKSGGVAHDFMSGLDGGALNVLPTKCAAEVGQHLCPQPDELNFQMEGDLTITIGGVERTCKDFRIGQGSYNQGFDHYNNWWVGSSRCLSTTAELGQVMNCNLPLAGCDLSFHYTGDSDVIDVKVIASPSSQLLLRSAGANQCASEGGDSGTSTHLNHFTFQGADAVSFAMTSYSVTGGQPVTTNCLTTSANVLTFEAGRKKSGGVAHDFMSGLDGGAANVLPTKCAAEVGQHLCPQPDELNFQMEGDLTITIDGAERTCKDFRIGQGSYNQGFDHYNNWWVGSSRCLSTTAELGQVMNCDLPLVGCGLSFHYTGDSDVIDVKVVTP